MKIKQIYIIFTATIVLLILAGCSSSSGVIRSAEMEPDTFSEQDMAVYKADNSKERISYGMSRKDAEKVLGTGNEGLPNSYTYESGVSVLYREDKAVAITLRVNTEGIYRTARGAHVGMTSSAIKELYGEKYAIAEGDQSMEYYYDTKTATMLERSEVNMNSLSGEELVDIHLLSTAYNAEGKAVFVILMDGQAANTFK
ncbi:hypothetical protein D3C75_420220 [compost metagenome]